MEYRGVRFTIRVGIERDQWHVVIHTEGQSLQSKILGTRRDATLRARSMIDTWLRRQPTADGSQESQP
jgi:hypothetical protein